MKFSFRGSGHSSFEGSVKQLLLHSPRLSQLESPSVFSHLLWMSALFSPLSWNFS